MNPYSQSTAIDDGTLRKMLPRAIANHDALLLSMLPPTPPYNRLSDDDVQRIAEAVVDEQERRAVHPLRVSAADVRRWMR